MRKTGYKRNTAVKNAELFRYADSVVATKEVGNYPLNKKVVLSYTRLTVKGSDWLNFVKDYKLNPDVYKNESNTALLDKFISTTTSDYYRKHLEEYSEDFKYQMQEFKEGNMLFEIMEKMVWSKAANDSVGLQKFYSAHKEKYKWAESADVLLFNCSNNKTAEETITALRSGKNWKLLSDSSDGKIQADSGRYELAQLQLPTSTPAEGLITAPAVNSTDNTASFVKILKIFPANQQRSFEESKGLVINEYQNFLEDQWVAELKKKYPVKIQEEVFKDILNQQASTLK